MNNINKAFDERNIPYNDIDPEMRELIYVLNFQLNLKTDYCCYGHDEYQETIVVFNSSVKDSDILNLAERLASEKIVTEINGFRFYGFGEFNKCVIEDEDHNLVTNWNYQFPNPIFEGDLRTKCKFKEIFMENLLDIIKEI